METQLQEQLTLGCSEPTLKAAIGYSLFPGGKRVRPVLSLLFNSELGGDQSVFGAAAASLEYLHCASLIHDDLPALDNDDMRRGRPSCHKACGEASAILAGDMMTSLAVECIRRCEGITHETRSEMTGELMRAYASLCEGQQMDVLEGTKRPPIQEIASRKTGALFGAAMVLGALGAGASEHVVAAARNVGVQFGVCFQLLDDYVDVFGSDAERGREGSSDERKGKKTFFSGRSEEEGREEWQLFLRRLQNDLECLEMGTVEIPMTRMFMNQLLSRVEIA